MTTLRTGVDLVDIVRVRDLVSAGGTSFLDQVWTAREQDFCDGDPKRLATRWGAKEATMKALGTGFPDIPYCDIEVLSRQGEMPELLLAGRAAEVARDSGLDVWTLSFSHEGELAVAMVVALGGQT